MIWGQPVGFWLVAFALWLFLALRRLHRIKVTAERDRFAAPDEEARVLVMDLHGFLAERMPLDVEADVELAWA